MCQDKQNYMSRRAVDAQPVVGERIPRVSVAFIAMRNVARTFPPSGRYRDALDAPELGLSPNGVSDPDQAGKQQPRNFRRGVRRPAVIDLKVTAPLQPFEVTGRCRFGALPLSSAKLGTTVSRAGGPQPTPPLN